MSYLNVTPSGWSSVGSTLVISSGATALGGMLAIANSQYAGIRYQGSTLSQTVATLNSTSYNLMFSSSNRPSSAGGVAPLLIYAFNTLVAAVTPAAKIWTSYQFQFARPNASISSFQLTFKVGAVAGDVMLFVDNVTLLSDSCSNCMVTSCSAGRYFFGGGTCGVAQSCALCSAGYYCTGGTSQPVACAAGNYNPNTGSNSTKACQACVTSCAAGFYLANACSKSASVSAASCLVCPSGSYCNTTVISCPMFTTSAAGSSSLSQCVSPTYGGTALHCLYSPCTSFCFLLLLLVLFFILRCEYVSISFASIG